MNYKVTLTGDAAFLKHLQVIANNLSVGTEEILDRTAESAKSMMIDQAPVFTGKLKESIDILNKKAGYRAVGTGLNYGKYVEQGGGTRGLPNVSDLENRVFYGGKRGAWAFAKYLQRTGKAIREASWFVKRTASVAQSLFESEVYRLLRIATR